MAWRKLALLVVVSSVVGIPCAQAQRAFEITSFGGSRFAGQIDESTAINPTLSYDYVGIKSSVDYGVMGDVTIWPNVQAEILFNRQPTQLSGICLACGTSTDLTNANIDMYQFGLLYQFRDHEAKLRPYIVGGLGLTHFSSSNLLGFSNRFSFSVGGGVKYFFVPHVGLRLEARWAPSRTTTGLAEYCDPYFGCYQSTAANMAEQGEVNLGLIFRFK